PARGRRWRCRPPRCPGSPRPIGSTSRPRPGPDRRRTGSSGPRGSGERPTWDYLHIPYVPGPSQITVVARKGRVEAPVEPGESARHAAGRAPRKTDQAGPREPLKASGPGVAPGAHRRDPGSHVLEDRLRDLQRKAHRERAARIDGRGEHHRGFAVVRHPGERGAEILAERRVVIENAAGGQALEGEEAARNGLRLPQRLEALPTGEAALTSGRSRLRQLFGQDPQVRGEADEGPL